jgi:hypothetical protein
MWARDALPCAKDGEPADGAVAGESACGAVSVRKQSCSVRRRRRQGAVESQHCGRIVELAACKPHPQWRKWYHPRYSRSIHEPTLVRSRSRDYPAKWLRSQIRDASMPHTRRLGQGRVRRQLSPYIATPP